MGGVPRVPLGRDQGAVPQRQEVGEERQQGADRRPGAAEGEGRGGQAAHRGLQEHAQRARAQEDGRRVPGGARQGGRGGGGGGLGGALTVLISAPETRPPPPAPARSAPAAA